MKKNIFLQFPAVKKAYENKVPHEIPEKQFWIQFFQSTYFHRKKDFKTKEADRLFESFERQITKQKDSIDINSDLTKNEECEEGFGIRKDEMTAPSQLDPYGEVLHDLNKESSQFVKLASKDRIEIDEEREDKYVDLKLNRKDVFNKETPLGNIKDYFNIFDQEIKEMEIKGIEKIDSNLFNNIMNEVYNIIQTKDDLHNDMNLTDDFLNEFKKYFIILNELFVHFWMYGKVDKLMNSIENYKTKLIQFKEKNKRCEMVIDHLLEQIEIILNKKKRKNEEELEPRKKKTEEVINID